MYQHIVYTTENNVGFIRLNEPDTLNAMSTAMGLEVIDAINRAETETRSIVLSGAGRAFCSGANLYSGAFEMDNPNRDAGIALEKSLNPLLLKVRNCEVPVIVAIQGAAAGVGCGIALSGDIIIASDSAFFLQAFCNVGLSPDGGSTYLLSKAIGRVRAMELMLLGKRLPAKKALEWGLITELVRDDELQDRAKALAEQLASGPQSLKMIRDIAWSALDSTFEDQILREREMQKQAGRTDDFTEGVRAFKEKRKPKFKGC